MELGQDHSSTAAAVKALATTAAVIMAAACRPTSILPTWSPCPRQKHTPAVASIMNDVDKAGIAAAPLWPAAWFTNRAAIAMADKAVRRQASMVRSRCRPGSRVEGMLM